jgi:hypothetical protein
MIKGRISLSQNLFWDTDYESLDPGKHARYIIERVIMSGTLRDWNAIMAYYGRDKILEETLQSRELDPKSLSFLSCIFDTPPEKFRCYAQIQSSRTHWTF